MKNRPPFDRPRIRTRPITAFRRGSDRPLPLAVHARRAERFTVHAAIDGTAMAIRDRKARQKGLQFQPESLLTPEGDRMRATLLELRGPACRARGMAIGEMCG